MNTLVNFVDRIGLLVYILSGVGIFFAIRGLVQAIRSRRIAVFGLEREAARQKQRRSFNIILLLLLLCGAIYINSNIIAPNLLATDAEPTPTPVVFVTQQASPTPPLLLYPTITPTPGLAPAEAAESGAGTDEEIDGCQIIGANITEPQPGQNVSGQIVVQGQANILGFAQYKFEIKGPGTNDSWVVVGTFTSAVPEGFLGTWDSTSLLPGNYTLRMVVSREDGSYPAPCEVPIVVISSSGEAAPSEP